MDSLQKLKGVLIVAVDPYFLEKERFWFEKNLKKILQARKFQTFFEENTLYLEENLSTIPLSLLLRKLDEMNYEKVISVEEMGEFSHHGGLVDIFPVNLNSPVRIEFYGNRIENIYLLSKTIEDEKKAKERLKNKLKRQKQFSLSSPPKEGEYLVHLDHGIGRFVGMTKFNSRDYYVLEYAQGDKLYVPVGLERKLSKYIGFIQPSLSRLSSPLWSKTKRKVKEEAEKLAKELLTLYAQRQIATRPPYPKENDLLKEFESSFPYEETPDQKQAIEDIKEDLQKETPMDRLICGDVGFGKTEIALRTAFHIISQKPKQAAIICPTTILAYQHFKRAQERLKNFPIKIALLSRLQSKKEQKEVLKNLQAGKIDLLIGTHRILSDDVKFADLGLLIIDDEHRFGVKQKEKLKKLKPQLDVLSLSATPIPRTLYLTLSSLKSFSLIQTPPLNKLPTITKVLPWQENTVKEAIEFELKRGGQVYYLHNRIETIEKAKRFLTNLFPKAKIAIAHAKLSEKEITRIIDSFQNKEIDILIATTIIENGLDLENANTIIVADATRLGLSQAHQIRGRVGRAGVQAFAYFFYNKKLSQKAKLRLKTLQEFQELGAGYKIALRDLEIRGAGNILGKEQSGNINKVGLNLYCQLLSEAIEKLKN